MIVKIDVCIDLRFEVCLEVVVFQQDAVFQGFIPPFDLSLNFRMVRSSSDMPHFVSPDLPPPEISST